MVKEKKDIVVGPDYRMKIINFLKIYGYYKGILVKMDIERKYISGSLSLSDIIQNKKDYKELKMSVLAIIRYCNDNNFDEMARIIKYFYKVECFDIKKKYGSLFDRGVI